MARAGTATYQLSEHPTDPTRGRLTCASVTFENAEKFEVIFATPEDGLRYKVKWRNTANLLDRGTIEAEAINFNMGDVGGENDVFQFGTQYKFKTYAYAQNNDTGVTKWRRIRPNVFRTFAPFASDYVAPIPHGGRDWLVPVLHQTMA